MATPRGASERVTCFTCQHREQSEWCVLSHDELQSLDNGKTCREYLPGEIIGFDAIHQNQHQANIVALDTSAVCHLPFSAMTGMARNMPELQQEIFSVMSQRICELETIAADLSADERIALFLKSLSSRFARRGYSEREFILSMSRRDIASYLRLATETVSRVLARFQQRGIIEVDRKLVKILDTEALDAMTRKTLQ